MWAVHSISTSALRQLEPRCSGHQPHSRPPATTRTTPNSGSASARQQLGVLFCAMIRAARAGQGPRAWPSLAARPQPLNLPCCTDATRFPLHLPSPLPFPVVLQRALQRPPSTAALAPTSDTGPRCCSVAHCCYAWEEGDVCMDCATHMSVLYQTKVSQGRDTCGNRS